jgi:hypothetical protein
MVRRFEPQQGYWLHHLTPARPTVIEGSDSRDTCPGGTAENLTEVAFAANRRISQPLCRHAGRVPPLQEFRRSPRRRECRNRSRNAAAGPPDLASPELGHGDGPEVLGSAIEGGAGGLRPLARDQGC